MSADPDAVGLRWLALIERAQAWIANHRLASERQHTWTDWEAHLQQHADLEQSACVSPVTRIQTQRIVGYLRSGASR